MVPFRVGFGYDVHQLKEGLPLMIGGIRVIHYKGASGHSDADVLLHAICDSLLGAAGLRDIGYHFPDSDPALKGIDSMILLRKTVELVRAEGWQIGNIDCTIALQKPRISQYIPDMQNNIDSATGSGTVSVKATTTEHLGFTGREEGIQAWAVTLLYRLETTG
ncbi:MAG: 2-C-methyl-D-erythritol 2,4-cyclodiphosphate synthase [Bacteroidales bacterium]|nr:2-C-methyl-D-erythritol 2,4-cyclodiphosphate synthase [Bacteroidales bacterium]